jgi:zinc transport system ATP-binding protein
MPDVVSSPSLLVARGLSKRYGDAVVVRDVSLSIDRGEIITLIGPNGAGKTTLLKLLLGLEKPDSGTVTRAKGLRIGYVPQHCPVSSIMPLTLAGFLQLAQRNVSKETIANTAVMLSLESVMNAPLHGLSGGQMRRALLARALLHAPDILVLDEPVAGVDITGQSDLYKRIRTLAEQRNMAVLMVSHDLLLVMAGSTRVLCLNQHICCFGKPDQVGVHPEFVALFGADVASQLTTYVHHHDHHHSLAGEVIAGEHGEGCQHG